MAGSSRRWHRDCAAAQAQFGNPSELAALPNGRVLVSDNDGGIRVLTADLQDMSTLTIMHFASAFELLPDGHVLVGGDRCVYVREGFPAALGHPQAT